MVVATRTNRVVVAVAVARALGVVVFLLLLLLLLLCFTVLIRAGCPRSSVRLCCCCCGCCWGHPPRCGVCFVVSYDACWRTKCSTAVTNSKAIPRRRYWTWTHKFPRYGGLGCCCVFVFLLLLLVFGISVLACARNRTSTKPTILTVVVSLS